MAPLRRSRGIPSESNITFSTNSMPPTPAAAGHDEPAVAAQVQVTPVSDAGTTSTTWAPATGIGAPSAKVTATV